MWLDWLPRNVAAPSEREITRLRLRVFVNFGIALAILGAITEGGFLLVASGNDQLAAAANAPVPVTAAVAVRRDVPDIIETIGTVQSIDSIAIQSQATGPIVKIEFEPGEDVHKDQELFLVDPRPYQAALDLQQAQLAHDQALLGEAEMDLDRYQTLVRQNSIAKQKAQDQAYLVEQDKATVRVDQANVDTAKINLGYCHITSPISGRAGVLLVDLGNLVGPGVNSQIASTSASAATSTVAATAGQTATTTGLVSVNQMKPIYVSFPVGQTLLHEVRQNQAAGALEVDAYSQAGKLIATGKLTVIDNQVNTSTGTVTMQGTFANTDEALWPGEFVQVELVVSIRRNVVVVPAPAVMAGPNGSYLYVINPDNTVHRVDIQVAARRKGIDVIEKGVSDGEKVVTDGQNRLANGYKVDVRGTSAQGLAQR
jgi:membrane fusion protein, multidrug efflux system